MFQPRRTQRLRRRTKPQIHSTRINITRDRACTLTLPCTRYYSQGSAGIVVPKSWRDPGLYRMEDDGKRPDVDFPAEAASQRLRGPDLGCADLRALSTTI